MSIMTVDLHAALDLNDNGRVAWPDLLGWTVLGSLGLLGSAVMLLMVVIVLRAVALAAAVPIRRVGRPGLSARRPRLAGRRRDDGGG